MNVLHLYTDAITTKPLASENRLPRPIALFLNMKLQKIQSCGVSIKPTD
jgi:hypothetical protein